MLYFIIMKNPIHWATVRPSSVLLFALTLFFVIFLLFSVNTIYSLMSFAGIVFCVFLFLLTSGLEFFALIYLLIYIGAIIVFFLFSIMLLHLKFERIFEFEVSHATAMLLFCFLNFFILIGLRQDIGVLARKFNKYYTRGYFEEYLCSSAYNSCIYARRAAEWRLFLDSKRHYELLWFKLETTGLTLFTNHGFLCFIVVFILLIVMFGSMQLIQYVKSLQKFQIEEVDDKVI